MREREGRGQSEGPGLLAEGCELYRKWGAMDKEMRLYFRKVAERRAWDLENRGLVGRPSLRSVLMGGSPRRLLGFMQRQA